MNDTISAAQAAYDAANAALADAHGRMCTATGDYAVRRLGPGWRAVGVVEGAHATRQRRPGCGLGRPVMLTLVLGDGDRAWCAYAEHEGRDSDRSGTPDPTTEGAYAATPRDALLALAEVADGMASRGRLPRRIADLAGQAGEYIRVMMGEVDDG